MSPMSASLLHVADSRSPSMQSTARKGTTFTIVSKVAMMTDDRTGVGHVVTEYGAVNLRDKSTKERALALIDIAYPSFASNCSQKPAESRSSERQS
jgi:acyl-CoA hydrolase